MTEPQQLWLIYERLSDPGIFEIRVDVAVICFRGPMACHLNDVFRDAVVGG